MRAVTDTMEEEISQLRTNLVKARKEKENLEVKMKNMEVILKIIQLYFSILISRMKYTVKQSPPNHLLLPHHLQNHFYPIWSYHSRRRPKDLSLCQETWISLHYKAGAFFFIISLGWIFSSSEHLLWPPLLISNS